MCVASSNAVKSITKFYGETDGRLGSSASKIFDCLIVFELFFSKIFY